MARGQLDHSRLGDAMQFDMKPLRRHMLARDA